jgi:NACalpha-BTF3-like transcription factor
MYNTTQKETPNENIQSLRYQKKTNLKMISQNDVNIVMKNCRVSSRVPGDGDREGL